MRLLGWFLLGCLLAPIHCKYIFAISGENFTFPVEIDKEMVEITWKKNKNKVAEWDLETETMYYRPLRNRSLLHTDTGSLTIFNLEESDAGTYVLECLHSEKEFILDVFAAPPEPNISCNVSGDYIVLRCAADYSKPLHYAWHLSSSLITAQTQEFITPRNNVVASERATCFIKVSQTERSSTISLTQCFPEETGDSPQERGRYGLTAVFVVAAVVSILVVLRKVMNKCGKGRPAQRDGPMHGSGEHHLLHSMDNNKEHPTSDRDKELNRENSHPKDKYAVYSDVHQEEVTQGAEGGNEEDFSNSPRCSKEDLKSQANRGSVDQTTMEKEE